MFTVYHGIQHHLVGILKMFYFFPMISNLATRTPLENCQFSTFRDGNLGNIIHSSTFQSGCQLTPKGWRIDTLVMEPFDTQTGRSRYIHIVWNYPPPSNSHHQDYSIFSRESRTKPSFVTGILGAGVRQNISF